jgi:hypothetical protein
MVLLADAEAVGYAMFPWWEVREHVAGYSSGSRCRCNVRGKLWVRSWVARIREAEWQKTARGCRILVW